MSSPPTSTRPKASPSSGANGIPVIGREVAGRVAVGGLANVTPSTDAVAVGDAVTTGDAVTVVGITTTAVTGGVGVGVGVGVTVGVGVGVTVGVGELPTQLPLNCTLPDALTAKVSLLPGVLPDLLVSGVHATCTVTEADVLAPATPVWVNA